ncbi:MAG: PASTA domain-containing protein [Dictyoglomaceae bacterium]|nr:PASTA domain-containing protein [Dictyoglomaceae bacterium]
MKKFKYFLFFLTAFNIILLGINLYTLLAFINPSSEKIFSIPDVRDKDIIYATKILTEKGFKPRVQGILMDRKKEDLIVLDQNPLSKAPEGSIIDLWINQPAKMILVPDLRYEAVESARNKLEKLGLRVEVIPSEEGFVVRQVPDANFYIERGSNVLLWTETYRTYTQEENLTP